MGPAYAAGDEDVWKAKPAAPTRPASEVVFLRPPLRGWKVPYDGPVDESFVIGPVQQNAQADGPSAMGRAIWIMLTSDQSTPVC